MTAGEIGKNVLGGTGLTLPAICFGTSGLGDMPETYGYGVEEDQALVVLLTAME